VNAELRALPWLADGQDPKTVAQQFHSNQYALEINEQSETAMFGGWTPVHPPNALTFFSHWL
jgi:hypothetical protein